MWIYDRLVNFTNKDSLNFRLRQTRLRIFLSQISNCKPPINILDVGGSAFYWEHLFFTLDGVKKEDYRITITNIDDEQMKKQSSMGGIYNFVKMDARDMSNYKDQSFDSVHSNSVLEHVGGFYEQLQMAKEVRRVGRQYFLQTPNYYFPIEPHFKAFFFHWLPRRARILLVRLFSMGHLPKARDKQSAEEIVDSAQLTTFKQLEIMFPEAIIHREIVFGMTKSFIVTGRS